MDEKREMQRKQPHICLHMHQNERKAIPLPHTRNTFSDPAVLPRKAR